ncbi:hypothetical protein AB0C77_28105 [Streptomyces sp. NPDC048629]|uniref:hypothetical protein n=1 Tax=Streptomyces sp. NPDC048629 TaxID=3154824 RepID=UPI003442EEE3
MLVDVVVHVLVDVVVLEFVLFVLLLLLLFVGLLVQLKLWSCSSRVAARVGGGIPLTRTERG